MNLDPSSIFDAADRLTAALRRVDLCLADPRGLVATLCRVNKESDALLRMLNGNPERLNHLHQLARQTARADAGPDVKKLLHTIKSLRGK